MIVYITDRNIRIRRVCIKENLEKLTGPEFNAVSTTEEVFIVQQKSTELQTTKSDQKKN